MATHQHVWVEHARTSTVPRDTRGMSGPATIIERLMSGLTTFIFRCRDEHCGVIKTIETLGYVIEVPKP